MSFIKKEIVDKIHNAVAIEEVVADFVTLKKTGSTYRGVSPWNAGEKTPSFYVVPAKGIYKDFSSGNGGSAIDFLMRKEGKTYPEALEWLAAKYKIEVEYEQDGRTQEEKDEEKEKWAKMDRVLQLAKSKYAEVSREGNGESRDASRLYDAYIKERGWDDDVVAKWGIGIAADEWDTLSKDIIKGELYGVAEEMGLVKAKDGGGCYDVLRGRVTFEIRDTGGRLVGFAGRDYTGKPDTAKYINPKESFAYNKSRVLYGWQMARKAIEKAGMVYLVEGYTDTIAMHRMGLENTVGTCGTSVTEEHLRMLQRQNLTVCIVVEDSPGAKAADRTIGMCMGMGIAVLVCDLFTGGVKCDADDLAQKVDAVAYRETIEKQTTEGVRWWADRLCRGSMTGAKGKQTVVDIFYKQLSMVPADKHVMQEEWAMMMAAALAERLVGGERNKAMAALAEELDGEIAAVAKKIAAAEVKRDATPRGSAVEKKALKKLDDEIEKLKMQREKLERSRGGELKNQLKRWEKKLDSHSPTFKELLKWAEEEAKERTAAESKGSDKMKWSDSTEDVVDYFTDKDVLNSIGEEHNLPVWVQKRAKEYKKFGLVQLTESVDKYPVGIYFPEVQNNMPKWVNIQRCTNFTIIPLYHIIDTRESHRMVEICNDLGDKRVVEVSDTELSSQDSFSRLITRIGDFSVEPWFGKFHFIKLGQYIKRHSVKCAELKFLGWNPRGFWAFGDRVIKPTILAVGDGGDARTSEYEICEYDKNGIAKVGDRHFMSPSQAASRIDDDEWSDGGSNYEDEKYLVYVKSAWDFEQWADVFVRCYGEHGRIGLAAMLMATFRDLIYKKQMKCPYMACFGPPQSGKSAIGESMMRVFFAGKNSSGQLINAVGMSDGSVTDFALSYALGQFRNCVRQLNEWDPHSMAAKKYRGWLKSAFDGEARMRGTIESGRKKTETSSINVFGVITGQYADLEDGCSLFTRCLNLSFNENTVKQRTPEQVTLFKELKEMEGRGLSSIICEIVCWRGVVEAELQAAFVQSQKEISAELKAMSATAEVRIWENYSLALAFVRIFERLIKLPFTVSDFRMQCVRDVITYSAMVNKNGVVHNFWSAVVDLSAMMPAKLIEGEHYDIRIPTEYTVRLQNGKDERVKNQSLRSVLFLRFGAVVGEYQKEMRSRGNKDVWSEGDVEQMIKNQEYFIGLCPNHSFKRISTSAYMLDYNMLVEMGITLARNGHGNSTEPAGVADPAQTKLVDDLPF